jgi:ubiquinone/menaquinone biosynthesis C-methylase UbiE
MLKIWGAYQMDDRRFDADTALDWIKRIESEGAKIREHDIYPRLKHWVKSTRPGQVLEIGCGQGICSTQIDLSQRTYTGVDASQVLIDRAVQKYPNLSASFLVGNAYELPFSDGTFDCAFSIAVWHLLHDTQRAACELSRVLSDQGRFLIITANPSTYDLWTGMYTNPVLDGIKLIGTYEGAEGTSLQTDTLYLHSLDQIKDALGGAGLVIEEIETFRPIAKSESRHQYISIKGYRNPK